MGDDLYYVVLEMDEYENVGITEFLPLAGFPAVL